MKGMQAIALALVCCVLTSFAEEISDNSTQLNPSSEFVSTVTSAPSEPSESVTTAATPSSKSSCTTAAPLPLTSSPVPQTTPTGPRTTDTSTEAPHATKAVSPASCFRSTQDWERDMGGRIAGLRQLIRYQTMRLRSASDTLNFIHSVSRGGRESERTKTTNLAFAERLLMKVGNSIAGSSNEWTSNECCFKETRAACGRIPDVHDASV